MDLSVVVPTLNGRDRLASCLDSMADHAGDAEVIVVNGPSADGTSGMVRNRDDVDVLVETADRTLNVARNAGIRAASADAIAFVRFDYVLAAGWREAVEAGLDAAEVAAGPAGSVDVAAPPAEPEHRSIRGREVTYFDGGNVAFHTAALDALDGFDEYLQTGGARDAAHRLAAQRRPVSWEPSMVARREHEADGGAFERDWEWKYRALAYRLVKNYGLRPTIAYRMVAHAGGDARDVGVDVVRGEAPPTAWFGSGRDVVLGFGRGFRDGLLARVRDRSPRRNPRGISARGNRAVAVYDRR